jgi:hypothetical protein
MDRLQIADDANGAMMDAAEFYRAKSLRHPSDYAI